MERLIPRPRLNVRQPRWYEVLRYGWAYYAGLDRVRVTFFPEVNRRGQYVCPFCDRTFPDHYPRTVHEWRAHQGCPRYRAPFWDCVLRGRTFTPLRCAPHECTRGCSPGGPFRR